MTRPVEKRVDQQPEQLAREQLRRGLRCRNHETVWKVWLHRYVTHHVEEAVRLQVERAVRWPLLDRCLKLSI